MTQSEIQSGPRTCSNRIMEISNTTPGSATTIARRSLSDRDPGAKTRMNEMR
jgi:hypothetical protein